jgi:hypothetical protein
MKLASDQTTSINIGLNIKTYILQAHILQDNNSYVGHTNNTILITMDHNINNIHIFDPKLLYSSAYDYVQDSNNHIESYDHDVNNNSVGSSYAVVASMEVYDENSDLVDVAIVMWLVLALARYADVRHFYVAHLHC